LDKAHHISIYTWQSRRLGLRIKNSNGERDFLRRIAAAGAMRCYVLEQADKPLAFALGTQWKGRFHYRELGFDSAFAEYSPGTVLLHRLLEDLTEHDSPRLFDFGGGDADYKRQFAHRQTWSGPVLLVRRGLRPMTAIRLNQARRAMSRWVRDSARSLGVLRALRRIYRR
jgi:CelD/BcsL family acetyltransferase involved in cellulose biosynthesis